MDDVTKKKTADVGQKDFAAIDNILSSSPAHPCSQYEHPIPFGKLAPMGAVFRID